MAKQVREIENNRIVAEKPHVAPKEARFYRALQKDGAAITSGLIDIAETLSNLTGKWIKRIKPDSVEFADGETVDLKNLDWRQIKPLIWW